MDLLYAILTTRRKRWLRIIPVSLKKEERNLILAAYLIFNADGTKEINYKVFEPSILKTVKKEFQKYAETFEVKSVKFI